ncbi:MAG TPA: 50S ribosomal protein L25 [Pyrinomonadaceae bacterium]|jgi:large subunit ribosomal protein L25|nr:50S ribosomal protein L25 [Pyrinomonadaceae bacterium]
MAEQNDITVRATKREGRGKNDARRARAQGMVPLSIYGGEGGSVSALAPLRDLAAILRSESGRNTIFTIEIEGEGSSEVMFNDRQVDPIRGRLIHADLTRLVKGQKIEVTVPLHLTGEPVGVREEQGVLEQIIREIEIRCEPREIPDAFNIDVSHLGVHDVLHVSDIPADERIEILTAADTVIATVGIVKEEAAAPVAEAEGAAEPEVIGKGKKEDEEGGEADKGKKE